MCLQEILYQSTITDEIVRLLDISQKYETLIHFSNSCRMVNLLTLPIIQQSYQLELERKPTFIMSDGIRIYNSIVSGVNRPWDLPSSISLDGTKEWRVGSPHNLYDFCFYDELHRDHDLPAVVYYYDTKMWYRYGQIHRDNDRPAVIDREGSKKWYSYGKLQK